MGALGFLAALIVLAYFTYPLWMGKVVDAQDRKEEQHKREVSSLTESLRLLKSRGRRVSIEYNDITIDYWDGNYTYVKDETWKKQVADMTHRLHLLKCKC